jgi:hypothetical protein
MWDKICLIGHMCVHAWMCGDMDMCKCVCVYESAMHMENYVRYGDVKLINLDKSARGSCSIYSKNALQYACYSDRHNCMEGLTFCIFYNFQSVCMCVKPP